MLVCKSEVKNLEKKDKLFEIFSLFLLFIMSQGQGIFMQLLNQETNKQTSNNIDTGNINLMNISRINSAFGKGKKKSNINR